MTDVKTNERPIGSVAALLWHLERTNREEYESAKRLIFDNNNSTTWLAAAFNQIVREDDVRDRAGRPAHITGSKIRNYRADNLKGDQ